MYGNTYLIAYRRPSVVPIIPFCDMKSRNLRPLKFRNRFSVHRLMRWATMSSVTLITKYIDRG